MSASVFAYLSEGQPLRCITPVLMSGLLCSKRKFVAKEAIQGEEMVVKADALEENSLKPEQASEQAASKPEATAVAS